MRTKIKPVTARSGQVRTNFRRGSGYLDFCHCRGPTGRAGAITSKPESNPHL